MPSSASKTVEVAEQHSMPAEGSSPSESKAEPSNSERSGAGIAEPPADSFVSYNGGVSAGYRWSQTISEIVLYINVGGGHGRLLKGKDIDCSIARRHIRVGLKSAGAALAVDEDLHDEVTAGRAS